MPKNKRNKVIALSKVKKKPRDAKAKIIDEVRQCATKYKRLFLVSIENERASFLQEVRKRLRDSRLICAKNKVMQLALGADPSSECEDGIHKISRRVTGACGLLFSDKPVAEVQGLFLNYRPVDFARSGSEATDAVTLPRGTDALAKLPHSIEAHLRACGLPTQLKEGKIHLLGNHTVCKEGDTLSTDAAQVLKLLDIKQAKFTMAIEAHWERGGKFEDCNEMGD